MTYFYSIEWGDVVSIDRVRSEYQQLQSEGYYLDESFEYYLEGCMSRNNGDLVPLDEYSNGIKRRLHRVLRWMREDTRNADDYLDEIDTLALTLAELEKYRER